MLIRGHRLFSRGLFGFDLRVSRLFSVTRGSFQLRPRIAMSGEFRLQDLNRKQMEEERLARLAKKRALDSSKVSDDDASRDVKRVKQTTDNLTASSLSAGESRSLTSHQSPADTRTTPQGKPSTSTGAKPSQVKHEASSVKQQSSNQSLKYPHGILLKTWAFRHERKNDIKFEEIVDKHNLTTGIFSSYVLDFEWLASKLNMNKTKVVLVLHERDKSVQQNWKEQVAQIGPQLELLFPPLNTPYGCMHSKLMLLFYKTHLRIVVPSANLIGYDWGESGLMENTVFLIDLPRIPDDKQGSSNGTLTKFSSDMIYFLKQQGIRSEIEDAVVKRFDFSATKDLAFVATIHGSVTGDAIHRSGYPALSRAVEYLGLASPKGPIEIDATASSIGSLNVKMVHGIQKALSGSDTLLPTGPPTKAELNLSFESITSPSPLTPKHFRIFYPSQDTVRSSTGGAENGGTLFLKPSYWAADAFPRELFRDQKIRRSGLLSHSKLLFVRTPESAFIYSGSANISQSAWGNLSWDKKLKEAKLFAPNWECGVLFPVKKPVDEADISTASEGDSDTDNEASAATQSLSTTKSDHRITASKKSVLPMQVFESVFDVPFEWPGKPFRDGQRPWDSTTDLPS